jgi:hypothetical protein
LFSTDFGIETANKIEDKRKGISKLSKRILSNNQLDGITANKIDAITATVLL